MEACSDSASESFADSEASSAKLGDDATAQKFPVEFSDPTEIEELLNFLDEALCKAVNIRRRKNFLTGKTLDLASIERLGVKDRFVAYFERIGWSWLLCESSHPVYQELALEFFSTFKFVDTADLDKKCISFRLFNMHHDLSLSEWSVKLGICTLEEVVEHDFRAAYCGLDTVESDVGNAGRSWALLARSGASPFDASRSSVCEVVDPVLRMSPFSVL
ncbi:uncharacterized protein LOC131024847 [Salvia miltiorrhiza]|uniref:uncharacterized protein LOC131024847 n=1 Tax=Salvia miltiorrhiza TaxID=226208 RepID=UPI0025AD3A9F|nr:uncharacterized protein LOC131024847 [Salvia miltiorrhiza]XP_057810364.1 uncharacterized protein LOC131024847 [Salvia miltiorrhiza]